MTDHAPEPPTGRYLAVKPKLGRKPGGGFWGDMPCSNRPVWGPDAFHDRFKHDDDFKLAFKNFLSEYEKKHIQSLAGEL